MDLPSSPVDIVQRQLDAYNQRNLDAFMACYSPNVQVLLFPNGHMHADFATTSFRERYRLLFENSPTLRCEVVARIVKGSIVIDHELVYGWNGQQPPKPAVAMYQVEFGFITRVWFVE